MQTYDFLMIAVVIGTAAFGFAKGMAWQIASLASLAVSYFVVLKFSGQMSPFFGESEPWNKYVAMLVIYIGCSFVIWLAFRFVSHAIDRVKLKEFDRQMGALFGLAKGVLLCVAITFFAVSLLPPAQKEMVLQSRSGHYIGVLLSKAEAIVPAEFHNSIGPLLHKVNERVNPEHNHADGETPLDVPWPDAAPSDSLPHDVKIDWSGAWPDRRSQ